jgi:RimJ/RimL family protein N-acetyltransferase
MYAASVPVNVTLREVIESDLPIFFEQQRDPLANRMAAFTSRDPDDRAAFTAHWRKILADATITNKTIVADGEVVGHVASYLRDGHPEVTYWIGKEHWGKGLATRALEQFVSSVNVRRPLYGCAAQDNVASLRVLEKCGFRRVGQSVGFARARGEEIAEVILRLDD